MVNNIEQSYFERLIEFGPAMLESLGETGIMMILSVVAAILLGLPLGTYVFLTSKGRPLENNFLNQLMNTIVNVVRSFPFLLLVIVMQPIVRETYGRATGDPIDASFPIVDIEFSLYVCFVVLTFFVI